MTFDLLDEQWVPVVDRDGRPREVSLAEALLQAHTLRWVEGEAPVVTAAMYRLLLALAHRAFGPASNREWHALWSADRFPEQAWQAYREKFNDRFDLFGPRPFLQCSALPAEKMGTPAQLVLNRAVGNNATLFDHTTSDDVVELDPAVAARWLVTVQAFDTGGLKTPYRTDKSSERGLCNYFGTVVVEGATLKETLLLNMPVYCPGRGVPVPTRPNDCPQWELDQPPGPEPDKEGRAPRGWTDLLTWPTRRILLREADRGGRSVVDGVVITPGTRLRTELAEAELMAAFRQPRLVKSKKGMVPTGPKLPVQLEEQRGVWRYCRELLLPAPPGNLRQRPKVLDHVADRAPEEQVYSLRVFGQQLDQKGGAVHTWLQETVPAPVALLRVNDVDERVEQLLGFAVGLADDVGSALERAEKIYDEALRREQGSAKRRSPMPQWYWPRLSVPFSEVLRELGTVLDAGLREGEVSEPALFAPFERWRETVRDAAKQAIHTWAWKLPRESGRQVFALAEAEAAFQRRMTYLCRDYDIDVNRCRDFDEDTDD
ncbi:type I-E CRISPR-associated protein Cse1/CasA [Saccharomonospora sp. NB11]|uniref:type I-E CRISPR-associated protein Cse1/CasA n=1 Tax=Saccharomonospora sp. NB11 TaxID=1642298 RepID=UPI0027DD0C73|nr:type I-E CRISPR-associated protein Cse1/CasA [Saccharomonospora sp. NB11]